MTACTTTPPTIQINNRPEYPEALLNPPAEPVRPSGSSDVAAAQALGDWRSYGRELRRRLEIIACVEAGQDPKDCGLQEYSSQTPS